MIEAIVEAHGSQWRSRALADHLSLKTLYCKAALRSEASPSSLVRIDCITNFTRYLEKASGTIGCNANFLDHLAQQSNQRDAVLPPREPFRMSIGSGAVNPTDAAARKGPEVWERGYLGNSVTEQNLKTILGFTTQNGCCGRAWGCDAGCG